MREDYKSMISTWLKTHINHNVDTSKDQLTQVSNGIKYLMEVNRLRYPPPENQMLEMRIDTDDNLSQS